MISEKEKIAYTEVLNILNHIEQEYYTKIPKSIIELLKENSIKYYQYYDENGQTKISDLTEQILCYLNLEFWCDNEAQKQEFLQKYRKNDEILNEQFDVQKIFDKRKHSKSIENSELSPADNLQLIELKKKPWQQFIQKIISFFKK